MHRSLACKRYSTFGECEAVGWGKPQLNGVGAWAEQWVRAGAEVGVPSRMFVMSPTFHCWVLLLSEIEGLRKDLSI